MDSLRGFSAVVEGRCKELQDVNYLNFTLSLLILLGIFGSYLPQHYRIIKRESSEGISPWFVLLGATSGTSAFGNILVLPLSRADVACCKTVSSFECVAGLLGIAQVGVQWFCFTVILLLYLIFFPKRPSLPTTPAEKSYTWQTAVAVAFLVVLHMLAVICISIALVIAKPQSLGVWASVLGIMATILAGIQYLPQIWMTWRLRDVGSLSIPMMLIQTPGSFIWSASLAARYGWAGWSNWGVFLVTGSLQGCLLGLGIYFSVLRERANDGSSSSGNGRCFFGFFQTERAPVETDDEGTTVVENGPAEREPTEDQPLIGTDPRRSSRRSNGTSSSSQSKKGKK